MVSIEHVTPQSEDKEQRNKYDNCVLACRFCNSSRGTKPKAAAGEMLLNPTEVAWQEHFEVLGDCLTPVVDDPDAAYTHRSYNLDAPIKVNLRRFRRTLYDDHFGFLPRGPGIIRKLLATAAAHPEEAQELLVDVKAVRIAIQRAETDLKSYAAVTADCPKSCVCGSEANHSLPEWMLEQTVEF